MEFLTNEQKGIKIRRDTGKYSRYFICPECFEVTTIKGTFENYIDYSNFKERKNIKVKLLNPDFQCYCDDCDSFMFDCDEHLVDTIVKFNKAGFTTEFCCQGHHGDERASDIGCLYSTSYIRFANIPKHDWETICNTLHQAILYVNWKEYFQINHMEKFMNNLERVSPGDHPIEISDDFQEIYLNSQIFDNLDVTMQEFDQIRFYFCTVMNQVACILFDKEERSSESE